MICLTTHIKYCDFDIYISLQEPLIVNSCQVLVSKGEIKCFSQGYPGFQGVVNKNENIFYPSNPCLCGIQEDVNNQRKTLKPIRVYLLHIDNNNFLLKLHSGHEQFKLIMHRMGKFLVRESENQVPRKIPPSPLVCYQFFPLQIIKFFHGRPIGFGPPEGLSIKKKIVSSLSEIRS